MKNNKLINTVKSIMESEQLDEMAVISGDLKSAIEAVINANSELAGLELKKKIKADEAVITALKGAELYDNQLNKFIALAKGERTLGQRGRPAGEKVVTLGSRVDALSPENQTKLEKVIAKMENAKPAAKAEEKPETGEDATTMEESSPLNEAFIRMKKLAGIIK